MRKSGATKTLRLLGLVFIVGLVGAAIAGHQNPFKRDIIIAPPTVDSVNAHEVALEKRVETLEKQVATLRTDLNSASKKETTDIAAVIDDLNHNSRPPQGRHVMFITKAAWNNLPSTTGVMVYPVN